MSAAAKPVIAVAFYSTYGHVAKLAEGIIKGIESTGATAKPFIFRETLPEEVRVKMHAAPQANFPVITPDDLKTIDGLVIGTPTRYGRVPAQVSNFFDATGQLWMARALKGLPVTQFTSVGSQHGGHESTVLTTMPYYIHHGLIYVPLGYGPAERETTEYVHGITPYGASTVAGDGSRQPLEVEMQVAEEQGREFAKVAAALKIGRAQVAANGA